MLSVQLLGRPRLLLDGLPVEISRRKSRALVYYIAAHQHRLAREQVLPLLWPDLDRPSAQQALRVALHGLRKTIGQWLVADKDLLAMSPETEVDVRLFESRLSPPADDVGVLTTTLDLYRGEFLTGFSVTDADEFDDWIVAERERYRRLAVRGLIALAEHEEKRQNYAAALEALDRALAFDPLQEDIQRACMRLHYLSGDRAGAIRRFESLRKLLDEEMGVPPMTETRALYDAIITDTLPPSAEPGTPARFPNPPRRVSLGARSQKSDALPFTGRDAQLQTLRSISSGTGRRLVLIEGEPGIGKTRLAEEFTQAAGSMVLRGAARELERTLPYQPVIGALRSLLSRPDWSDVQDALRARLSPIWLAEVGRLLPELVDISGAREAASPTADEWRLWEGVNQFLLALSGQGHVVAFLDDLHWADSSTLGLLGYLLRHTASAPICFLGATRPFPHRSPLATLVQALTREGLLARLNLPRLERDDLVAIARQISPGFADPLAAWLLQKSEGIPYVVAELVRYARERGFLTEAHVNLHALASDQDVPPTVYSLIQARLERLSEVARRVLDTAVAVGREFDFDVVSAAAGVSENAALDAIDELAASGLIHSLDGSRFIFDHNLTMEVAFREMGETRHRILHRHVAEALESLHQANLDAVAGHLAWQFAEGNAPERAAPYAFRAGQRAARLAAWDEAISLFEQALASSRGSQRLSILMALGGARLQAGRLVQASDALREALALAETRGDEQSLNAARLALAQSLLSQARFGEAIALAQRVSTTARLEDRLKAEFTWGTALSIEGAYLDEADAHLATAEALCGEQASADPASLSQIRFERGSVAAQQGDLVRAVALYREAADAAASAPNRDAAVQQLVLSNNNLGYHLLLLNDPTAGEHAMTGLQLAEEKGLLGLQPYLLSTLGEIALAQGDLATAEKRFLDGLALAERLAMPERIAGLTANLGLVALRRGETPLAIHRLSTALASADALGTRHLAAQIRIWLAPLLPSSEARTRLREARTIAEDGGRRRLLDEIARLEQQLPSL